MDKRLPLEDLKVLVVEDEAFIAMAIADELENAGAARVAHAFTLSEAEDVVETESFEVAILDLRLPDGTSRKLAKELVNKRIPVVFHSGHAEAEQLQTEFPEAAVCPKPCQRNEFVTVIAGLLGR